MRLGTPAQRAADDNDIRQQYDLARHESLALCVAHNFRLKGVARLIEALAVLPAAQRRRVRVVVVGRDNPVPYLRLAARLGVSDRVVFAGSTEPTAYCELKSIGLPAQRTSDYSKTLCQLVAQELGIAPSRTYIEFANATGDMWGWNNETF